MKHLFYIIILLFSVLFNCSPKKKERRIKVDNVVDYREVLFGSSDSLPVFELSNKKQLLESLKANDYWFDDNLAVEYKWFNLQLNSRVLKVGAFKESSIPGTMKINNVIEVIVSKKNQLFFERKLEPVNHLDTLLFKELISFKYNKYDYLIFQWDERSDLTVIDKVFNEIETGYTLFYDSIAKNKYNSELHNLGLEDLLEMKEYYPFKVVVLTKIKLPLRY